MTTIYDTLYASINDIKILDSDNYDIVCTAFNYYTICTIVHVYIATLYIQNIFIFSNILKSVHLNSNYCLHKL